jgi:hypothetical protein
MRRPRIGPILNVFASCLVYDLLIHIVVIIAEARLDWHYPATSIELGLDNASACPQHDVAASATDHKSDSRLRARYSAATCAAGAGS